MEPTAKDIIEQVAQQVQLLIPFIVALWVIGLIPLTLSNFMRRAGLTSRDIEEGFNPIPALRRFFVGERKYLISLLRSGKDGTAFRMAFAWGKSWGENSWLLLTPPDPWREVTTMFFSLRDNLSISRELGFSWAIDVQRDLFTLWAEFIDRMIYYRRYKGANAIVVATYLTKMHKVLFDLNSAVLKALQAESAALEDTSTVDLIYARAGALREVVGGVK